MDVLEPKKLALIRMWQIFHRFSDYDHPLTQNDIARHLSEDYGIVIDRKAISRNISRLKELGADIESCRAGSYLETRQFEDSELMLLIDGVLCSQHISSRHSADLVEKLCGLSNEYFRSHVKNIHTIRDWNKTENNALFYNIETIDMAIEEGKQLQYDYNKFGLDKKLHKSSSQQVTPYQLILHNQKYYLMAHSTRWDNMVFHRLDRISNIKICDDSGKSIREIPGYENGIDYKKLTTTMPYMFTDDPERIMFTASVSIIDQVIDWFGKDISITKTDDESKVTVSMFASPTAMMFWALQYLNHVEILSPVHLRDRIKESLAEGLKKYNKYPGE